MLPFYIKKIIIFSFILFTFLIGKESFEDVIYLKDGTRTTGTIIEQLPGKSIKIMGLDGKIVTVEVGQIEKISKERPPREKVKLKRLGLWIQPLGVFQFGPLWGIDLKLFRGLVISFHHRWAGAGYLYRTLFSDLFNVDTSLSSMAAGGALKWFFKINRTPHDMYAGLLLEYAWGKGTQLSEFFTGNFVAAQEVVVENTQVNAGIQFGYRWNFRSGVFINAGLVVGISKGITFDKYLETNPEIIKEVEPEILPVAFIETTFGWQFGK